MGTGFGFLQHIAEKHSSTTRPEQRRPEFSYLPALTLLLPSLYSAFGAYFLRHFMPRRKAQAKLPSNETNSSPSSASSIVRVGPAGWSYPDWAGYVYPSRRPKGFHKATYLPKFFPTFSTNTPFHHPLPPALPAPV